MERQPVLTGNSQYYDPEAQQEDIDDPKILRQIRHGFLRKVYGILLSQFALTLCVGAFLTINETARHWILSSGLWLIILSAVVSFGLLIALVCVPRLNQAYPTNYILLTVFTAFESIAIGGTCAAVSASSPGGAMVVLQALMLTGLIVAGLTAFAFQTKYDFVSWAGAMGIILLGLVAFGLVRLFFPRSHIVESVYAAIMALVFCVYILIDTQLIVGRGKIRLSEDQYIIAALTLYLDIVNLFLNILKFLSEMRRDN